MRLFAPGILGTTILCSFAFSLASADDWPMYRADATRSGHTAEALPDSLDLCWEYSSSAPRPAWPSSARISYDFAHQPIVVGDTVIVGSSVDDSVVALDAASGELRWRYFTGGPVRFAPAAWKDRVFVASDDGHLHALSMDDGKLLWKHRGGPNGRMCLGNERMISRWPARGGPLVLDDTVYYAAGIWPSSGVFLHALNTITGDVVWSNGESGDLLMPQPHPGAEARSGVTPQGYLVATAKQLFAPTGRAVPAAFTRDDGQFEYYLLQENGSIGGSRALASDRFIVNGGCFLEQATGKLAARAGRGVFSSTADGIVQFTGSELVSYRWNEIETHDRKGEPVRYHGLERLAEIALSESSEDVRRAAEVAKTLPALGPLLRTDIVFKEVDANVAKQTGLERTLSQSRPDVERLGGQVAPFHAASYERTYEVISAGNEAVCGGQDSVAVVDLKKQRVRWTHAVNGNAVGLAAACGRLLVSTTEGQLLCFAEQTDAEASDESPETAPKKATNAEAQRLAAEILRETGVREGFCLDVGCGDGSLALELIRQSDLQIIGIEPDADKVAAARKLLAEAGVYGTRATIHHGSLEKDLYPDYFADLIVSSAQFANPAATIDMAILKQLQRPHGGVLYQGNPEVQRRGPLEGAGRWTHQNSNAANTLCSDDTLVRGPLETAWYRDGVLEIVDRHAQGPAPLYNRGVLVVEGVHGICGLDAYNGRTRWVFPIEDVLADWDGVHHDVGVGDTGSNFCLSDDAVFVRTGPSCVKIDLQTGRKLAEFTTPTNDDATNRNWGYVAYADGLVFGTVLNEEHKVSPRYADIRLRTESVLFFVLDAETGKLLWQYDPEGSLRSNAIAIADGRVYLIDRQLAPADRIGNPTPNGKHRPLLAPGEQPGGTLIAMDARTGGVAWKNYDNIWGTQLAVSTARGKLLMAYQAVKHGFFKLPSEVGGRLAAFAIDSGKRAWDHEAAYRTRPIINDDTIYTEDGAWNLETGEDVPWEFRRSYGCGQIASSRHLMLFRSATLGYLDLSRDAGTENFGGIRPSCWFNAIPAGGLVLVPDGSAKCACSYQMQAWLALQTSAAE
jgi:outer membrane protein assembly factor BamB